MAKKRVAGFNITIGTDLVGCITGWTVTTDVSEEEVSCLSDTIGDPPIIDEQYLATAVNHTASLEGVSVFDDAGQSALQAAADAGATVTLEYRYYDGSGYDLTGYFTSFELTGSKGDFAETFSGDMRVNTKSVVAAS